MTRLLVVVLTLAMLPVSAFAAPPAGGQPVVVTSQPPSGQVIVVQQQQPQQPAPVAVTSVSYPRTPGNYDKMARALRIERVGVLTATVGLALEVIALALWGADNTDRASSPFGTEHHLLGAGIAVTGAGLVTGSVSGLIASNQLYRFGVPNHYRGLAITSLVFAFMPFANVIGYVLNLVHLRRAQAVASTLQRVSVGISPMMSSTPGNNVVGTRLSLRF